MNFLIYKTITSVGIFIVESNLFVLFYNHFKNKTRFYKKKNVFVKHIIKMNPLHYYFIIHAMYVKYGNYFVYLFIMFNYNHLVKCFFDIERKKPINKIFFKKQFRLYEIKKIKNIVFFFIYGKILFKNIKKYGIGMYKHVSKINSYKNLLKTILM
ncbi:hypothetical protein [Candidatus Carsonella ruddii]|uniref:Uncharacterized protein n=1 Tax=Candidatus Carsonella ruddii (Diaphorina cf. continua) TaxID=2661587 RepID=A0A7R6VZF8_CARRU|nr:hypothetical protein [Candidatus Carsonella ruddii (Diaphorina cf. continua)]BCG49329.1 hypothetical protein CRDco_1070 [Candidatus Carsonella ruddii (Diaphorina cf. continua)]